MDLSKYCIETAIKRSLNRLLSEYFRIKGDDPGLEKKLSLLQNALLRFDFPCLRTMDEALAGNSSARIILRDNDAGLPVISIDGRSIDDGSCIKEIPHRKTGQVEQT